MTTSNRRIAILTNTGWNMIRFRRGLVSRLAAEGWEVTALADFDADQLAAVRSWGVGAERVEVDGSGTDPFRDLRYLLALLGHYRRLRPTVVHHFSIKPVVYGSVAAKLAGVPRVVSSITGLGSGFGSERRWLAGVVRALYRAALAGRTLCVCQNRDDLARLVETSLVDPGRAVLIPGSGVDTIALRPDPRAREGEPPTFLMVSRMLWTKGVGEFVAAARRVRSRHASVRFVLIGGCQDDYASKNADFVPRAWLEALRREGIVEWLGWTPPEEVEARMRRCTALVHPSYYPEGIPRTLIEAASAGVPIITTDSPGCRDAVIPERTGLLCPPRDPEAIAAGMLRILGDPEAAARMGAAGRRLAEEHFDEQVVLDRLLGVYSNGLGALETGPARRVSLAM